MTEATCSVMAPFVVIGLTVVSLFLLYCFCQIAKKAWRDNVYVDAERDELRVTLAAKEKELTNAYIKLEYYEWKLRNAERSKVLWRRKYDALVIVSDRKDVE